MKWLSVSLIMQALSPSPQSSPRPLGTELPKEEEGQTMKYARIFAGWQSRCSDIEVKKVFLHVQITDCNVSSENGALVLGPGLKPR